MSGVKVEVKLRGQGQSLRSNSWCVAVDIRGSACQLQVQQKTITLRFRARSTCTITSPWTLPVIIADAVDQILI